MRDAVDIPVTVKHRIGIDNFDGYEFMADFVDHVVKAGCQRNVIVHARTAWLQGLTLNKIVKFRLFAMRMCTA